MNNKVHIPMEHFSCIIEVMIISGRGCMAVSQPRTYINANVGLHAKVTLVALFGLVHIRIALLLLVFGRRLSWLMDRDSRWRW